jgi:hypothetical protein
MAKVKRTLTLDEDIVEIFLADDPDNLSGAINAALREAAERKFNQQALRRYVDQLETEFGPVDEAEVARISDILRR